MERLEKFEVMLEDILKQLSFEEEMLEKMKAEGKTKTATYRQYLGNKMIYRMILEKYRKYGLLEEDK